MRAKKFRCEISQLRARDRDGRLRTTATRHDDVLKSRVVNICSGLFISLLTTSIYDFGKLRQGARNN